MSQLPITVIAGEATIEAALRVRVQAGTTVEVFGTGFDFELGIYVDLLEYTAVILGESHDCGLYITESVDLAVGVFALAVLEIDYHKFLAIPAEIVVLLKLDLPSLCLPAGGSGHHSATGYPTLPTPTGYPTHSEGSYPTQSEGGYPTHTKSTPSGYPTQSEGGYPTHSEGGYPTHSEGGYPTHSEGGYPTQSEGGYPTHTDRKSVV